jgi:hypothetical protein
MASVLTLAAPALATTLVVIPVLGTVACTVEEGRPPLARIELVPEAIPENDGFQTPVVLDGTASADPIDDPDGSARLDYAWAIDGDEHRFDEGDEGSDMPTLSFRGDRPATIVLTVTDADGLEASATVNLQLSVR